MTVRCTAGLSGDQAVFCTLYAIAPPGARTAKLLKVFCRGGLSKKSEVGNRRSEKLKLEAEVEEKQ